MVRVATLANLLRKPTKLWTGFGRRRGMMQCVYVAREAVAALSGAELWFTVLGPVRAWRGDVEIDIGAPQQRTVFGLLLLHAGRPAGVADIVDAMWGDDPPGGAVNAVHRSVGLLRRALEPGLPLRDPGRFLVRSAGGYRLTVDAASVDLLRFRGLVEQARAGNAVDRYAEALDLWTGWAGGGLGVDLRTHPTVVAVHREYLSCVREAADLALATGASERLLGAVELAAGHNPLDEPLHARLVRMLSGTGRQAEALAAFQKVRERLVDELGIDPGAELTAARDAVLRPAAPIGSLDKPGRVRPAQLPADLPTFTGRRGELTTALALPAGQTTVVIRAIGGAAGIGKTTFAIHWAYQIADRFPDGQLYVNLRGFEPTGQITSPAEALRSLLTGLGIPAGQIPDELDARAALYRSVTAGQRLLVVLDNARDVEQVHPLLPGSPGCLVIVTSRNRLSELSVTHSAHLLTLDVLPAADARDFLGRRIGAARLAAEQGAVDEIVAYCGGLPLALAIVAARAVAQPTFPLATFADQLRSTHGSLDAFAGPGAPVNARTVFSWSYHALTASAATLFRLLGVHPGPDIDAAAAVSLAGTSVRETHESLAELQRAHLVTERVPGRYLCHDLLRAYATELVNEDAAARDAARLRLTDHYLRSAMHASLVYTPSRTPNAPPPGQPGVRPVEVADTRAALAWFVAEEAVLLNMVGAAERWGLDIQVWKLIWAISPYALARLPNAAGIGLAEAAVEAAHRSGDRTAYARTLNGLALAVGTFAEFRQRNIDLLRQSLAVFTEIGDLSGQARVHVHLVISLEPGDPQGARFHADRALTIYDTIGDPLGRAHAGHASALAHLAAGDHRLALVQARQLLDRPPENAPAELILGFWNVMARAHRALGDLTEAMAWCQVMLDSMRSRDDRNSEAMVLDLLGDLQLEADDPMAARLSWRQALHAARGLDHPLAESIRAKLSGLD